MEDSIAVICETRRTRCLLADAVQNGGNAQGVFSIFGLGIPTRLTGTGLCG